MSYNSRKNQQTAGSKPSFQHTPQGRGYQLRNNYGDQRYAPPETHDDKADPLRKPYHDARAVESLAEGRRVYVGSLRYEATIGDINAFFQDVRDTIDGINMSVDDIHGKNPSYCFIDFKTKELAEKAIEAYDGKLLLGRKVVVKKGQPRGSGKGKYHIKLQDPTIRRTGSATLPYDRWRRMDTPDQFSKAPQEGRRLYVGRLPHFVNQQVTNARMRKLFEAFQVDAVSKQLYPHASRRGMPGNAHYCFVDLHSVEEAELAIKVLNDKLMGGCKIRVMKSYAVSDKLLEQDMLVRMGGVVGPKIGRAGGDMEWKKAADEDLPEVKVDTEVKKDETVVENDQAEVKKDKTEDKKVEKVETEEKKDETEAKNHEIEVTKDAEIKAEEDVETEVVKIEELPLIEEVEAK